jgi:N-acetylmuramoyl-L-alanine amidase
MARPIANAANVKARTRRRQGSPTLLRSALVIALVVVCVFSAPVLLAALRPSLASSLGAAVGDDGPSRLELGGIQEGACVSFGPTSSAANRTVFLDPGHGGLDPGVVGVARGKQVLEKDVTLAVATRLATLLRADGYRVVMSRTGDSSVTSLSAADSVAGALTASAEHRDLVMRTLCANAATASVLLSIHFDAFEDPSVGGTETFYDTARPFAVDNERLANALQSAVVAGLGTSNRGVWTDKELSAPALTASGTGYGHLIELGPASAGWVDQPSQMPGALVEPLFLTNEAEARLASDPAGQARIAAALRAGLQKYFGSA